MGSLTTLYLLGLSWTVLQTDAYALDSSCNGNADLIAASADAAINMAAQAHAALTTNPRNPDVDLLISLLFCKERERPDQIDLAALAKSYEGISALGPREDSIPFSKNEDTQNKVVILCSMDRVKKQEDGTYVENTTGNIIKDFKKSDLDACQSTDLDLASTWPTEQQIWQDNSGKTQFNFAPSQVTLCSWFVKWASEQPLKLSKTSDWKAKAGSASINRLTKGWPYKPIDALALLDKVLLHEFTHTVAGGKKKDEQMKRTDGDPLGKGYGWKAALTLAKQTQTTTKDGDERSALLKSDSLALFGSGIRLLNQNPRMYIQNDGSYSSGRPDPANLKRAMPVGQLLESTPAAFEGFITMIREARAKSTTEVKA